VWSRFTSSYFFKAFFVSFCRKGKGKAAPKKAPTAKVAMSEWISNGQSTTTTPTPPVQLLEAKPRRFTLECDLTVPRPPLIEIPVTTDLKEVLEDSPEQSPQSKKFKFAPVTSPPEKSLSSGAEHPLKSTSKSNLDTRKGFAAPRKNAIFYGDSDSEDDFK
jgi:hypothetical protein